MRWRHVAAWKLQWGRIDQIAEELVNRAGDCDVARASMGRDRAIAGTGRSEADAGVAKESDLQGRDR